MWPTGLDLDRYPDTHRMRAGYAAPQMPYHNLKVTGANALIPMNAEILSTILSIFTTSLLMTVGAVILTNIHYKWKNSGGVDWTFNNYGELLGPDYLNDRNVAKQVIKETSAEYFDAPIILEGGAITQMEKAH